MIPIRPGIAELAEAAIGDSGHAERWLHTRSALYGGRTPLEALDTPDGRRLVERQLHWFAGLQNPVTSFSHCLSTPATGPRRPPHSRKIHALAAEK